MDNNQQSLVLVTGFSGFIGAHVADQLLKAGYAVRATVRDVGRAQSLIQHLSSGFPDKFSIVEMADMEQDGAFNEAVRDVDAIVHLASPVTFAPKHPFKDVIEPAVQLTRNLLKAAHEHGSRVKHVIITSSVSAVIHPAEPGYEYTEEDWNDEAMESLKTWKEGDELNGFAAYKASKNEAERAAWRFIEEAKPQFELTTILPVFTFGPYLKPVQSRQEVRSSNGMVYAYLAGAKKSIDPASSPCAFVDVRDVAIIHVNALQQREVSKGKRFLVSGADFTWQQLVDILRSKISDERIVNNMVEGQPGQNYAVATTVSGAKGRELLGTDYTSLEQSLLDTYESLKLVL